MEPSVSKGRGRRGGEEGEGERKRREMGRGREGERGEEGARGKKERKGKERKSVLILSLCGVYCMYNTNAKH